MPEHRNVVLILTDQQRRDSLGCYGNPWTATPNLDRLAAGGLRLDRCYCANPICMPNRLSIFTGRYPRNHGQWTNGLLVPEQRTLADHLGDLGWQTWNVGKMHLEPTGGETPSVECRARWERRPEQRGWFGPYFGFEHVELSLGHRFPEGHYRTWFAERGGTEAMYERDPATGCPPLPEELHHSAWVADRAAAFIREDRDPGRPFFLVASFPDPHHPWDPPAAAFDRYDPARAPAPVGGPEDLAARPEHYRLHHRGRWSRRGIRTEGGDDPVPSVEGRRRIAATAAMVELIDRGVGTILAALEEGGLDRETLVVFTTDHGELLGDHGLWCKGPFFYEGLVNLPCLVAGPGVATGASDGLLSSVDLAPTLCGWLGCEPLPGADGLDQSALLADPTADVREACLVEYRNGYGERDVASAVLVTPEAKYVRYQTGAEELTDLAGDPDERRDLAGDPAWAGTRDVLRARLLDELLATQSRLPAQLSHA